MFWFLEFLFIIYMLYCFMFCSMIFYTSIIEEWICINHIPNCYNNLKMKLQIKYYQLVENNFIAVNEESNEEIV